MGDQEQPTLSKSQRRRRNKRLRQQRALEHKDYKESPPEPVKTVIKSPSKEVELDAELCATTLISSGLKPRDLPIFKAICGNLGLTPAEYIIRVVRHDVIKHKPAYIEALGGGGSSSKNIEMLTEKLPPKQ